MTLSVQCCGKSIYGRKFYIFEVDIVSKGDNGPGRIQVRIAAVFDELLKICSILYFCPVLRLGGQIYSLLNDNDGFGGSHWHSHQNGAFAPGCTFICCSRYLDVVICSIAFDH